MRLYGAALLGAGIYVLSGLNFGIDTVKCISWPGLNVGLMSGIAFALALALMSAAWLGLDTASTRKETHNTDRNALLSTLIAALVLHGLIMVVPPFLSNDALAYGAIGSATALHGQSMYAPLGESLPATDSYALLIVQNPEWLAHGSTYGPAFNIVADLIVRIAGNNVSLALRLFQGLSALAIFGAALFASQAAAIWAQTNRPTFAFSAVSLRVLRLVLFSPLALIEASSNAHNDALLALVVAVFAWLVAKSRVLPAGLVLAAGLTLKISGILLLAFYFTQQIAARVSTRRTLIGLGLLLASISALIVWLAWPMIEQSASTVSRLIGSPDQKYPFCTRSLECMPRAVLHLALDNPAISWATGLAFRMGGILLLVVLALRSRINAQTLTGAAAFIFLYYLFFHAYMQAWYLLSLLPLVYFLDDRLKPVAKVFIISSLAQYTLDFTLACTKASPGAEIREIAGWIIVLLPPMIMLAWAMFKPNTRPER